MNDRRLRPLALAALALAIVWVLVLTAFHFSAKGRMTAEKVRQFTLTTDLAELSPPQRDDAIAALADRVNGLPYDERPKWRRSAEWKKWFAGMTGAERTKFVAATLPIGFRQTLEAYSQSPADQRKQFVADAIQHLREDGAAAIVGSMTDYGPGGPPVLTPEVEQQARMLGLQEFYSRTSAETKAELAPLVEEMQRQLQAVRP